MKHVTAVTAQNNFGVLIKGVIELGESVSIATDEGTAILVSEDEWSGLMETLYLQSIPGFTESFQEARALPAGERLEDI